jgi:hypothetical protein
LDFQRGNRTSHVGCPLNKAAVGTDRHGCLLDYERNSEAHYPYR